MKEFESDWISLSQSQSEVRVYSGVNLREDNKVSESQDGSVWIKHGRI